MSIAARDRNIDNPQEAAEAAVAAEKRTVRLNEPRDAYAYASRLKITINTFRLYSLLYIDKKPSCR